MALGRDALWQVAPGDKLSAEVHVMQIAYVVVGSLLALVLTLSGAMKLRRAPNIVETMTKLGVPMSWLPILALAEFAAAVGLVAGIFYAPFGLAAAIGVVVYFIGASVTHLRKADFKGLGAPLFLLAAAVAVGALRALA